ncbi:MAG TPA: hypothetical protein VJH92_03830 [Candidatus Nanoarchaeia archaeon]|nr:hypothetical protein [Candidatus Nanoarchaeia archaeon]
MLKKMVVYGMLFVFLLFAFESVSSLRVSPSGREYNFAPGLEASVKFNVIGNLQTELSISAEGDLAKYITFDRTSVQGEGEFVATLKLPDTIDVPGFHRIWIVIAEKVDDELISQGMITTSVAVRPAIDIYVPYPGRYLDISLKGHDVNVGESVNFDLSLSSKGTETLIVTPRLDIHSNNGIFETLYYTTRTIESQEAISLRKTVDTSNYTAGNYKAVVYVDYGTLASSEYDFRIGQLSISILGYTNRIPIQDKNQAFDVEIESGWNDLIDGAYADVTFFNSSGKILDFRTISTTLTPWEKKKITGYFNSVNFTEGFYDANISVTYFGRSQGKSTSQLVKVEFFKVKSSKLWYLIGGIALLIIMALILIKILRKNGSNKKSIKKK